MSSSFLQWHFLLSYLCPYSYLNLDQREPELLAGNDVLWTFVTFAGEDHTNIQTLVAFLKMLSTLVCQAVLAMWWIYLLRENYAPLMLKKLVYTWFVICVIVCHLCIPTFNPMQLLLNWYFFRLLAKKVLQRSSSYFRAKHSVRLGGALCLIA